MNLRSSPAAAASSAATSSPICCARAMRVRAVDIKPLDEWYQCSATSRIVRPRPARAQCVRTGRRRERRASTTSPPTWAAWASSRTTRPSACCRCSSTRTCSWRPATAGVERFFFASSACVYAADKQTDPDVTALGEERRLSGDARGRLRLGEALQRAHVPALPRGLRPRDARRPLPQRLRPARHLGRRPREGAGRDLPQGRSRRSSPARTRSRSGATASRRAASCTSTTASTGTQRLIRQRRRRADQPRQLASSSRSTSSSTSSRSIAGVDAQAQLQARRAAGRARPQQRQHADPASSSAGSRPSACATAWSRPTAGSTTRWSAPDRPRRSRPPASRPYDQSRSAS